MLFTEQDPKKKKVDYGFDSNVDSAALNDLNSYNELNIDIDSPNSAWNLSKERTKERINNLASLNGTQDRFKNAFTNYMLPKDTPERRRRVYATSPQALEDAVGDYYNTELKKRFETNRDESKQKARNEYMKYTGVVGANPINAYQQAMREDNPMDVIDRTMDEIDYSRLAKDVSPLASYAGFETDEYVEKFVKPSLQDKMINEYVEENRPKSSAEYMMRSAIDNSVVGKVSTFANNAVIGNNIHSQLEREGLTRYNASRFENFVAGVGGLLIDTPVFGLFGALGKTVAGKATSLATNRLATRFIARNAGKNISREYARDVASRAIKESLSNKIMQSAMGQGVTLGNYDLTNSVVEDLLYNSEVDFGKAAGSFAKGFATGGAVGAIGTPLRSASAGLTGGKKLLASTGVLSAESAMFTIGSEAEKIANGVEIEPIDLIYDFGESAATLLTMRMAHWRPKGAELKLDNNGRIKEKLRFTDAEKQELKKNNVDADGFMAAIEQELNMPSFGGKNAELVKESYSQLMSNRSLSASLRSKLLVLIENKITSTPPLSFDYTIKHENDGTFVVTMLDANGGVVERKNFNNIDNAKNFITAERSNIRRNRISYYEQELTNGFYTQNFLRQGGKYIKEKGINANALAEAMLKKANNKELTTSEQKIINDVIERSSYDNNGIIAYLYDKRREIESHYNFEKDALLKLIDKPSWECSTKENRALDEYEKVVREEFQHLRNGVEPSRYNEIFAYGLDREFNNVNNDVVKGREQSGYDFGNTFDRFGNNKSFRTGKMDNSLKQPISIPDVKNSDNVWNTRGLKNTKQDIENYKKYAEKLSAKLNLDVKLITDERDVELVDRYDNNRINEYNKRLNSLGWVNNGTVYLNLPNIESVGELEKTAVHEIVTHAGLKKIFGNHMNDFLEEVYRKADRDVLNGIREVKRRNYDADGYAVVEEYLAELTEKRYHTPQERGVISRFKDFIKNMLVRKNIYTGKNRIISEKELEELMYRHSRHVLNKGKLDDNYRRSMFSGFESANYDDIRYNDEGTFDNYVKRSYDEGSFMGKTPRFMHRAKILSNYNYLPDNAKAEIRKKWNMSDSEINSMLNNDRYRFLGKKGAENLAIYNSEDSELDKAIEYEAKGSNPASIKYMTGWERGKDREWRKEVPDNDLNVKDCIGNALLGGNHALFSEYYKLTNKPIENWSKNDMNMWDFVISQSKDYLNNLTLNDLVSDPTLFISYPDLKKLPVKVVANSPELVRYDSKNKRIVIDRDLYLSKEKNVEMAGALQNVIQDYEDFSRAVSLHLIAVESSITNEYEKITGTIDLTNSLDKIYPKYNTGKMINEYLKNEYGMTPAEFNKKFPTLDDFFIYKLSNMNVHLSGDVEMNNVKKRFDMSPFERRIILAEETEGYERESQIPVKRLNDMQRLFSGPLDIINRKLKLLHSDIPLDVYLNKKDGKPYLKLDLKDFERVKDLEELFYRTNDFGWGKYKKIQNYRDRNKFYKRRRRPGDDEEEAMLVN